MKIHPFALAIAASATVLLSSCATKQATDPNAPTGPPSATVSFEGGGVAYWASASGGKGTLNFNGKNYGFTASSVGAGGTGAQSVMASGKVYNLNSLSDFPGTYTATRSGLTIIQGKTNAKLTNSKGVVIYMSGVSKGLSSSAGVSSVTIKLD